MVRSDVKFPDQSRVGRAPGPGRGARRAAARPALGRPARGHPRRPAAAQGALPLAMTLAANVRLLALGRHRGLRPARRRGLRRRTGRLRHRVRPLGPAATGHLPPAPAPTRVSRVDLAPGLPDLRAFPLGRWVAALQSVAYPTPCRAGLPRPGRASPAAAGAGRVPGPGAGRPGRPGRPDRVRRGHRRHRPALPGPAGRRRRRRGRRGPRLAPAARDRRRRRAAGGPDPRRRPGAAGRRPGRRPRGAGGDRPGPDPQFPTGVVLAAPSAAPPCSPGPAASTA